MGAGLHGGGLRPKMEDRDSTAVEEGDAGEGEVWLPPAEQTGDGRTALNAKLGY